MSKQMTPDELARRKRLQANLSVTGGTIGLAALGAKGSAAALRRAGKTIAATKVEKPVVGLLTGGAGIGGVGAFNFAATQKAEAAGVKPKMHKIKKNNPIGFVPGKVVTGPPASVTNPPKIKAKSRLKGKLLAVTAIGGGAYAIGRRSANSSVYKAYNPEKNRMRRADVYAGSALVGSAGSAYVSERRFSASGGSGHLRQAKNAFGLARNEYNKSKTRTGRAAAANRANDIRRAKALKDVSVKHIYSAGKIARSKAVLVPLAASAGLAGTAGAIQSQKRNSGRPYSGWYDQKKKPKFSRVDNTTATSN